ncbi:hypothetical protein RP20_CCG025211 [Aedes albopictus]|nr:hypothetical protein RP20_CCG025211 [Aedes albopictus]
MLQHRTRANEARHRQVRSRQNSVFRRNKRQQEERDREAMDELYRAKDTRKLYEKLNRLRKGFVPQADTCRDNHGNLLTSEREMVERWRQHYDKHLNDDVANTEGDVVTHLVVRVHDKRFPAPNPQETDEVGRLKSNKAAGADQLPSL